MYDLAVAYFKVTFCGGGRCPLLYYMIFRRFLFLSMECVRVMLNQLVKLFCCPGVTTVLRNGVKVSVSPEGDHACPPVVIVPAEAPQEKPTEYGKFLTLAVLIVAFLLLFYWHPKEICSLKERFPTVECSNVTPVVLRLFCLVLYLFLLFVFYVTFSN